MTTLLYQMEVQTLLRVSSVYSDQKILGVPYPCMIGCNNHVIVHEKCDKEQLKLCAYILKQSLV